MLLRFAMKGISSFDGHTSEIKCLTLSPDKHLLVRLTAGSKVLRCSTLKHSFRSFSCLTVFSNVNLSLQTTFQGKGTPVPCIAADTPLWHTYQSLTHQ